MHFAQIVDKIPFRVPFDIFEIFNA